MRFSFRAKIVLGIVSIVSVFLVILVASNLNTLVKSHEQQLGVYANLAMDAAVAGITPTIITGDFNSLQSVAERLFASKQILRLKIFNQDKVLFSAQNEIDPKHRVERLFRTIALDDQTEAIVELDIDAYSIELITQKARNQSLKIILFEIMLLGIAAFALAVYLTQVLTRLTKAIAQVEQGGQLQPITAENFSNDEIGDTYRAFMHLQQTLNSTQQEHEQVLAQASQLAEDNSQKESWLKAIINQLSEGIITFDEQGTIHYTNSPAQKMLGYDNFPLIGLTVFDLTFSEAQQQRIRSFIAGSGEARSRQMLTRHRDELIHRTDGSAVNATMSLSSTRINDIDYFVLSVAEVSQLEQVERQMLIGDAIRTGILESSLSAIIAIDQDDRIVEFNPSAEKIFGYNRNEVMSQKMSDLIMPERFRQAHVMGMKKFIASGDGPVLGQQIEIIAMNSELREFPIELAITPIKVSDGHIFTAVINDISQRIKDTERLTAAKEEADRSNQEKSRFLASMSHEIRTPLNIMLGMVDLLQGTQLNEQQRHFLVSAENAGRNLLDMINDVLDLSKIEAGKMAPTNSYFEPIKLFEETVMLFSQRCWSKGLRLYTFVGDEIPEKIYSDAAFFKQIISNLMANAVNYTDSGFIRAKLFLKPINGLLHLHMEVCDSGPGLTQDEQTLLFQDFSQVQQARPKDSRGTGLGLVICREMANLLGGDISLTSQVGLGSSFALQLPMVVESKTAQQKDFAGRNFALVSESSQWCQHLSEQLAECGATVQPCTQQEGLNSLNADIILLDLVSVANAKVEQALEQLDQGLISQPILAFAENRLSNIERAGRPVSVISQPAHRAQLVKAIQNLLGQAVEPVAEKSSSLKAEKLREKQSGRILLVDDSEGNRLIVNSFLEGQGFDVLEAEDGLQAVELVRQQSFDLILMDMRMPNLGGVEATKIIRQEQLAEKTPIIALTAHALIEVRDECMAVGMQDFLTKPIGREQLLDAVSQWLSGETVQTALQQEEQIHNSQEVLFDGRFIEQLISDTSQKAVTKMLNVFHRECFTRLGLMQQAQKDQDIEAFGVSAHALKSSAKTFGLLALSELAREIEAKATSEMADQAWSYLPALEKRLNESIVQLQSELGSWWQPPTEDG